MSEQDPDNFSLWYRFRTTVIFNLLYLAGPASLDDDRNPRVQVEREYLRRKAIDRARKHGGPVELIEPGSTRKHVDPFVLMLVIGAIGLVFLLIWFGFEVAR